MTPQTAIALGTSGDGNEPEASGLSRLGAALGRTPPTVLMLLSILSIQLGSALATVFFSSLGPAGTAFVSTAFSAAVLTLMRPRPPLDRRIIEYSRFLLLFGITVAALILCYFVALQYIPLGIASTVAFLGPLILAIATSRKLMDFLWIGLALLGLLLLTPEIGTSLDALGLFYAVLAAIAWAAFVPLSKRGQIIFEGVGGLTLGMWVATVLIAPFAIVEGGVFTASGFDYLGACAVALLATILPFAMEYRALRRMSARTYGILLTLEPALGAIVGAMFLAQGLGWLAVIAIFCVTLAAMGVTVVQGDEI
ncbi:MAG: EamA family transporter [Rhizobiales bacterium]|nr:EamA family transporter [Hyphomicrobiales bacterium]